MGAREVSVNHGPAIQNWNAAGGDDVEFNQTISFNTTGMTVEVELRLTDDASTAADETLTSGSGLTVTPGATTSLSWVVPKELAAENSSTKVYFSIIITDGDVRRTWSKGTITYSWKAGR